MLLSTLVQVVDRVRATPRKTEKVALLADLLRPARGREAELAALYLTGTLPQGRIGLGWRTLQSAMTDASPQGDRLTLAVVDRLEEGAAGLGRFSLRLLSPIAPMLASTADDVDAAIERLGAATFEYKLDGARIQLHKAGDEVRVFTRHLQDVTARVPEVVDFARALPVREAVLEGEAIALRPDGRPQPFQLTMSRIGRSRDVEAGRIAVPLSSRVFACLFLDAAGSLAAV